MPTRPSSEEDATWAQAAITLRELVAQRTSHSPSDLVGRANRLLAAWPTGDDIPGEGWKSLRENYKKLTNSLEEMQKHSDAEVKLLDKSLELITVLVALRKAPEASLTDKRIKRPRASSPSGTPGPGSGANTRGVSITLPPRTNSVGPSANHKKKDRKGHPLAVNTKVAFWNGNSPNRTDDVDWILAIIVRVISNREGRIMYEVRDAEEESAEVITTQQKNVIPLPDPKAPLTHEFPVGSTVLALYPDTSCFYRAEVVATPRMQSSGGRQPSYKLKFEDDDNQEHGVAAEWVVEYPILR